MKKRMICCAMIFTLCLGLCGCWDYNGLNMIDIVSGIAVDRDANGGNYQITCEVIDVNSAGDEEMETKYVEAEGATIFEAIRNSKKRLINKLYGGNMQTLVISNQIAESEGVFPVLEQLLRDGETRETMSVVISQEETAREILMTEGLDSKIIAYELHDVIIEDNTTTSSTKNMPLYKAYNAIRGEGAALVLPAVRNIVNNGKTVTEANGIALFNRDRLIGFDSPQNAMLYLFILDEVQGGALSVPVKPHNEAISFEIKNNKTNTDVSVQDKQVFISIDINIKLHISEIKSQRTLSDIGQRKELEEITSQFLKNHVSDYFAYIQKTVKTDIFGLGQFVFQKDPNLWQVIQNDWGTAFQNAVVQVDVHTDITNAGVLKDY